MTGPILLLALSLKRARMMLMATGLLLSAFQVLLVLIAGSIQRAGEFENLASPAAAVCTRAAWAFAGQRHVI